MAFEDSNTPDGGSGTAGNGTNANGTNANGGANGNAHSTGGNGTTPSNSPERRGVTVRRAPRFVPFMVLGGLVGIIVAAVVAYGLPGDPSFDANSVFGFFLVAFGAGGVILGAIVALVLDRVSVRRAEHAVVESVPDNTPDEPGA